MGVVAMGDGEAIGMGGGYWDGRWIMQRLYRGAANKRRAMIQKSYANALCEAFKSLELALQQPCSPPLALQPMPKSSKK